MSAQRYHVLLRTDTSAVSSNTTGFPITRGSTSHFRVDYYTDLGANGPILADAVLSACEQDYSKIQSIFGQLTPDDLPFAIIIAPGDGSASHQGCSGTQITCEYSGADPQVINFLVVAEVTEVFEAAQNRGWDCGASNGEALSRVVAKELHPMDVYDTGRQWLDSDRQDYITLNDDTDRNFVSTGCAALFINYLRFQLGFSLEEIVQLGGKTPAQCFYNLTGAIDAFGAFAGLLQQHFPKGQPSALTSDNPFPLSGAVVLHKATSSTPGVAVFRNELHIAWKGAELHQGIFHSSSTDVSTWRVGRRVLGVGTSDGPSLAEFGGKLHMVWKGGDDQHIWHISSPDGTTWPPPQQRVPGVGTSGGPSLVEFQGKLHIVWKGAGADQSVWHISSTDGANWEPPQQQL